MPNPMSSVRERPWEFVLVDDLSSEPGFADTPSARSGLASMLSLPIPDEGQFPAAVNFFSRARARSRHSTHDSTCARMGS